VRALDDVSLEIPRGACLALTGPSGCGKSTLLNILGGLDTPDSGEVWVGETPLHSADEETLTRYRRSQAGIVFQFFNLLPSMTVAENVELPLLLRGDSGKASRKRVQEMLEIVGLAGRAGHFPHQLSGGEMQRAALARALAGKPDILLADEPTGNLDSANAARVAETLLKIASHGEVTMLIVTHSSELAAQMPGQLAMRDGKILSNI
jgi:lipoprotein-releasing system ATP-binding protein